MKFTEKWLKKHLKYDQSFDVICSKMTSIGFEVKDVIDESHHMKNFIISEIISVKKHPNAEKLSICEVFDGTNKLQIVCGAPNVRVGIKVILAPTGTVMPSSKIVIKQAIIRGIESNGMLCSEDEICLPLKYKDHILKTNYDDIVELPDIAKIGSRLSDFLYIDDIVVDIAITPNRRQDSSSVYGIARNLYASGIGDFTMQNSDTTVSSQSIDQRKIKIFLDESDNCKLFQLQIITNINQKIFNSNMYNEIESLLTSVGHLHKNPLVNLSNFYMFDLGRPNHIYDADKIDGDIFIRNSFEGEKFTPISMREISLPSGLLVIADNSKVLSLAGVIGGELSKVDSSTTNIAVEVANFTPEAVMNSGRTTDIFSESRFRFEGRIDQTNNEDFIRILTSSIVECFGGNLVQLSVVNGKQEKYNTHIVFNPILLKNLANYTISHHDAYCVLKKLGFSIDIKNDDEWILKIPSWRLAEVRTEYDIVEEIIRIYGFEHIKRIDSSKQLELLKIASQNRSYNMHQIIVETLLARGMDEVINWSFISEDEANTFFLSDSISIENPITNYYVIMRKTMLVGLVKILEKNSTRGVNSFSIFESGHVYDKATNQYQIPCISGLRTGYRNTHNIHKDNRQWDFYDVRDDVLIALENISNRQLNLDIQPKAPQYYHPTRSASIILGDKILAYCGELNPLLAPNKKLISTPIYMFEIFENNLPKLKNKITKSSFYPSQYQAIERDLAFVVNKDIVSNELLKVISRDKNILVRDINIFDVYQGEQLANTKKSIAIRIKLQSDEKTLTDSEINSVIDHIINLICTKFDAIIRDR